MKERIRNLSGIELGVGPHGEYYLFITSETLQEKTVIPLQASHASNSYRQILDTWIEEQLKRQSAD